MQIDYTAKRSLVTGHVVDTAYTMVLADAQADDISPIWTGARNVSLSGKQVSITHYASRERGIRTDLIPSLDTSPELVLNGDAILGDNTNFPDFTFSAAFGIPAPGSFFVSTSGGKLADEFIRVRPGVQYDLAVKMASSDNTRIFYCGIADYDIDKNLISLQNAWRDITKNTYLYEAVGPTDTTIKIVPPGVDWAALNGFVQWDIKDDFSDLPTQNVTSITSIDITNRPDYDELTIPASGKTYEAGTPLGIGFYGPYDFTYVLNSIAFPDASWQEFTGVLSQPASYAVQPTNNEHRHASFIKPVFLISSGVSDDVYFDDFSIKEIRPYDAWMLEMLDSIRQGETFQIDGVDHVISNISSPYTRERASNYFNVYSFKARQL